MIWIRKALLSKEWRWDLRVRGGEFGEIEIFGIGRFWSYAIGLRTYIGEGAVE
jgi:hypothetical protein